MDISTIIYYIILIWDYCTKNIALILFVILFIVPIIIGIISAILDKFQEKKQKLAKAKEIINAYDNYESRKQELIDLQNKNKQELLELEQKNLQIKNDIDKIIDNTQTCPYLANRISDYFSLLDTQRENYLKYKHNPAIKASEIVSVIKKEKKELLTQNKMLQYQLDYLISTFPMLESAIQLSPNELQEAIVYINKSDEIKSDYEIVKNYLSAEEYQKLSSAEKYQLALDRYLNKKKKTLWEIGISYERYVGYIYENMNYKVTYNGALNGFNDLGRDIIAENKDEILIIQCKYWRKEKVIRENVIFQLYGTMILKQLETKKNVKGILVTTTTLSHEAKQIANYLNIQIRENDNFDKTYPCIKCNINKTTKEKIYHLPFDQQYDRIQIDINSGEQYVSTVQEAEQLGFRRAKKHILSTK